MPFEPGEPVNRAPELHAGFLVRLKKGPEFTSFQIRDPEGNCVEVYCKTE